MFSLTKKHITPEDYLIRFEEYDDADFSHVDYFIEPYGPHEYNEMSDTHYKAGDMVPYHEHARGYETFLVDKGSVEMTIRGKRTITHKGDMVHIPPYTPHQFKFLEHDTIWRELFMEIQMNSGMMEHLRVKEYHRERLGKEFDKEVNRRKKSNFYEFSPEPIDVPIEEIPEIRPFDFGLIEFAYEGLLLRQKVKKSETAGVKEIWQALIDKGYSISWDETNPFPKLYVVYSGSVKVTLDEEEFVANERDIIHIPSYLAGRIETLDNTVLLDYNCQGSLLCALENLKAISIQDPEKMKDPDFVKSILLQNDCFMWFEKA